MGYAALILLAAAVLALPFAVWGSHRRERWRAPERIIVLAFVGILAVLFALSAIDGYFYPYGWPGHDIPGLRSSAEACRARYALARTPADSAAVDPLILMPKPDVPVPSCGTLRREHLPRCAPHSRCARLRAALRLPAG